ncbi:DUF4333 domain-containing protein [Mycobacterium branderi]|uniref:DUF4333 domain-containing protein n=1 Tax=Mycobacterium branderi TaxID=43348 RepID=A0A7I7WDX8_9MYCO|nr:DUF4333 domain-containing protein [Mycobacterium branderi]MCV7236293.1 DUF4333 domain-containing protein [Mycobacterium branderi]ORA35466.1 hypothetical protein BST20_17910 [Mycobacterium branderi]BBZ15177.1 hypothetical protein MBRA_53720 [Mycobacterium branderi]
MSAPEGPEHTRPWTPSQSGGPSEEETRPAQRPEQAGSEQAAGQQSDNADATRAWGPSAQPQQPEQAGQQSGNADATRAWGPSAPPQQAGSEQAAGQQPGNADATRAWGQPAPPQPSYQPPAAPYQQSQSESQQTAQYQQSSPSAGQHQQYGQPPGYPQQPGQGAPQYGQPQAQYGGWNAQPQGAPQFGDAFGPGGAPKRSKRSKGRIAAVAGALLLIVVVAAAVVGFFMRDYFFTKKLDISKAQDGVQQILTDQTNGYGVKNVQGVKCNNGQNPTVKKGDTFNCEVTIDGTKRQVTVTFHDDKGAYEVGRPK